MLWILAHACDRAHMIEGAANDYVTRVESENVRMWLFRAVLNIKARKLGMKYANEVDRCS